MSSQLPLELQYRVISLADAKTAAICALVCRDWVSESRKVSLSREIRLMGRWDKTAADQFKDMISHPACTIREHLTQVKLSFNVEPLEETKGVVEALIEYAPRVNTLNLDLAFVYLNWADADMMMYPVIRLTSQYLTHLKKLETSHWITRPESVLVLLTLLSNAPVLAHLILNLHYTQRADIFTTPLPPPPSSLRIFETDLNSSNLWETWIFNARNVIQYKVRNMFDLTDILCQFKESGTVGLHGMYPLTSAHHRSQARRFFASPRCAGALTHLRLPFYVNEKEFADIDLQHAVNLSSITIVANLPCGANLELCRSWIYKTLATARNEITVDYESRILCDLSTTHEGIQSFDEALDAYFELQLTTFRAVEVVIKGDMRVPTRFKLCEARARLVGRNFRFEDARKE